MSSTSISAAEALSDRDASGGSGPADKRAFVRHRFKGAAFRVRASGGRDFEIRLKDLSVGGACGLICEPVRAGDYLIIEFDARHQVEAQVCWARRLLVGVQFTNPLNPEFIERLTERRAESAWARPPGEPLLA